MNRMNRTLAFALSLALGISLLAGCGGGSSSSTSTSQPAGSTSADSSASSSAEVESVQPMDLTGVTDHYLAVTGLARDTVVGTVGGDEITVAELTYWLDVQTESYLNQLQSLGLGITEIAWSEELETNMLAGAMETAAFYRILPQLGEDMGLELSAEDLQFPVLDLEACAEELGGEDMATKWLWYRMMDRDLYSQLYCGGRYFQMIQTLTGSDGGRFYPTDAEVKAYVEDELGYYRVKHILLNTEGLDDAAKAEKLAQAEDLLEQLKAADDHIALFDELMLEYGEDPGVASNPDGYEAYPGQMVTEFEEASLKLKDGELSGIVESPFGYHIILRLPLDLEKYRSSMAMTQMDQWIDEELEARGIETTEAYDSIDVEGSYDNMIALKLALQEELLAAMQAAQEKKS